MAAEEAGEDGGGDAHEAEKQGGSECHAENVPAQEHCLIHKSGVVVRGGGIRRLLAAWIAGWARERNDFAVGAWGELVAGEGGGTSEDVDEGSACLRQGRDGEAGARTVRTRRKWRRAT